ncbi:hypothetical protein GJ654_14135 [Rhodoblastus acidophilus]|uniref:Uncharacterized protein n=1 Tax=Rhodoblastus acidophilus TaxID=1074 RepID=A0A6N8DRF1_RHOAC|nr:hypothetical protein [Rhodoblastus acidophilus]MCW2275628.1 hypothetical protein [Rhodoblastus acidophilus]MTV32125.1 hypothetical protein [Rhodoblastus acidophilus]
MKRFSHARRTRGIGVPGRFDLARSSLLYGGGEKGVLSLNASSSPAGMTLLVLETLVAGVQARVWQICGAGAGALLVLAIPAVEWLCQSPVSIDRGRIRIDWRICLVDQMNSIARVRIPYAAQFALPRAAQRRVAPEFVTWIGAGMAD